MDDALLGTDFNEVDKRDDLHKVLGWLRGEHDNRPIITDGKRPYAILDKRRLMGRGVSNGTRLERVAWPVPCIEHQDSLDAVQHKFMESLAPYLPVRAENGRTRGYVDALDVARRLGQGPPGHEAWLGSASVRADTTVDEALGVFASTHADHLPVLDKDHRVIGVLPRAAVLLIQEFEDQPMRRGERAGETTEIRESHVEDWMEGGWIASSVHDGFEELLDAVERRGYTFVTGAHGRYEGVVTAPSLLRRALERSSPETPAWIVEPHFRQA